MQCPKCGAIGQEGPECSVCGLIFAKYAQHHQQDHQLVYEELDGPQGVSRHINLLLLLIIVAAGGFYLFGGDGDKPAPAPKVATTENTSPPTTQEPGNPSENEEGDGAEPPVSDADAAASEPTTATTDLRLVMQPSSNDVEPLEQARSATVFITTPRGSGSGFFASDNCKLITSRSLVNADLELLAQQRQLLTELQQRSEQHSTDITKRRDSFFLHCNTDCSDNAYQKFMGETLPQQALIDAQLEAQRDEVARIAALHKVTVTLLDGSEIDAEVSAISDTYQLALATIPDAACTALSLTTLDTMQVGNDVYTLLNESGKRNALQGGKLTGSVVDNGLVYIQTTAPIDASNLGGPLLNETGKVVGVNTIVLGTEAGADQMAIPANYITEAFSLTLSTEAAAVHDAQEESAPPVAEAEQENDPSTAPSVERITEEATVEPSTTLSAQEPTQEGLPQAEPLTYSVPASESQPTPESATESLQAPAQTSLPKVETPSQADTATAPVSPLSPDHVSQPQQTEQGASTQPPQEAPLPAPLPTQGQVNSTAD